MLSGCLICSLDIIAGEPAGCRQPRMHFHMLDEHWDVEKLLAHNSALLFEAIKVMHKYLDCPEVLMRHLDRLEE